ncbi:MAG: gntR [Microvirga sp.]|nr:gntR [Microvirga sp.]
MHVEGAHTGVRAAFNYSDEAGYSDELSIHAAMSPGRASHTSPARVAMCSSARVSARRRKGWPEMKECSTTLITSGWWRASSIISSIRQPTRYIFDHGKAGRRGMTRRTEGDKVGETRDDATEEVVGGALDDAIYERIHAAIAAQNLPPGTRLREDEMRQIFGVSRARIRKVFSRLAHAGLVTIEPNKGASVFQPTPKEAREIFAARRGIEGTIMRLLSGNLPPADRVTLERHIAGEATAEARRDWSEMVRLSGEFHLRLAEISGNTILLRFLRELITREALVILVYEKPGQPSCSHHEHEQILEALVAGDAGRAAGLMDEHLANIEERLDLDRDTRRAVDLTKLFERG